MNRLVVALCAALALVCPTAFAQSQSGSSASGAGTSSSGSDVDNLFNGGPIAVPAPSTPTPAPQQAQPAPGASQPAPGAAQPAQGGAQPAPGAAQPAQSGGLRPDDILNDRKLHFFGSLDLYANVGGGVKESPDFSQPAGFLGYDVGGNFTAAIGFEIRPDPSLRIRGKLSYNFPGTENALPQLSEMFFDYSVLESVFFRVGIFSYTWGNSQFFQFGNLPSRSLPGWSGTSSLPLWAQTNILTTITTQNYPVSLKMSIPMGFNTLSFLARFDLVNYGNPPMGTSPSPKDAGYGLEYDLVTGPIEWSLAGFYQWQLTPRSLLSMKTSVFGFDLSAEATMAFPVGINKSGFLPYATAGGGVYVGGALQRIYPTGVFGLSREWTDAGIKVYAEYAYNSERDPGTSWLPDESGPGGHNSAAGVRLSNVGQSGMTLNFLWQQNWSDWSGLVAPFIEFPAIGLASIQVGIPVLYGSSTSEVAGNRLAPGGQAVELLILVKVSSSFRQ